MAIKLGWASDQNPLLCFSFFCMPKWSWGAKTCFIFCKKWPFRKKGIWRKISYKRRDPNFCRLFWSRPFNLMGNTNPTSTKTIAHQCDKDSPSLWAKEKGNGNRGRLSTCLIVWGAAFLLFEIRSLERLGEESSGYQRDLLNKKIDNHNQSCLSVKVVQLHPAYP